MNIPTDLNLPEGFAGGGGRGRGPGREPQEDHLLLLVLVHRQKLLLLRVEQTHHVPALLNRHSSD